MRRVGTDTSEARMRTNHRNRFFSRNRGGNDEAAMMESGMADIPEARDSPDNGNARLDPRSGLISPMAVKHSNENEQPSAAGALADDERIRPIQKAKTDMFEMRRFRR